MHKLILHLRAWNLWRKNNYNSRLYKFLVLIGFMKSPSMIGAYFTLGVREGLKRFEKNPIVEHHPWEGQNCDLSKKFKEDYKNDRNN